MVCGQENEVTFAATGNFQNNVSSKNKNNDIGKADVCPNSPSNNNTLVHLTGVNTSDVKMAFQANKVKMDVKNLTPAPDRPRIFMSNKTSKVVVVFPNGEVVEGKLKLEPFCKKRIRGNLQTTNTWFSLRNKSETYRYCTYLVIR